MYEVSFQVGAVGQLIVSLNGIELGYTVVGQDSTGSQIVGRCFVTTTKKLSTISIRNPSDNDTLTLTPFAGGKRQVSAHLLITFIGVQDVTPGPCQYPSIPDSAGTYLEESCGLFGNYNYCSLYPGLLGITLNQNGDNYTFSAISNIFNWTPDLKVAYWSCTSPAYSLCVSTSSPEQCVNDLCTISSVGGSVGGELPQAQLQLYFNEYSNAAVIYICLINPSSAK